MDEEALLKEKLGREDLSKPPEKKPDVPENNVNNQNLSGNNNQGNNNQPPPVENNNQPPADDKSKINEPSAPPPGDVLLKEILGKHFTSVEDVKKLNIPSVLDEVGVLRKTNTELQEQLAKKPKTLFINDEMALFNEFVRETGISDFNIFRKVNTSSFSPKENPMEILVTKYKVDYPDVEANDSKIEAFLNKKYGYVSNPTEEQLEDSEFVKNQELALFQMKTDASGAVKFFSEMKGKIKLPEPEPLPETPKARTPEEQSAYEKQWGDVGNVMSGKLGKIEIPIDSKDGVKPFSSYDLSEEQRKDISDSVREYAVKNNIELTKENVSSLVETVQRNLVYDNLPKIVHSIFEKVSKMTKEEVEALYHHPSAHADRNNDTPPQPQESALSDAEKRKKEVFDIEMGRKS